MIDNNDIEKRLASAINAAAPDILDDLMAELDINEVQEPSLREKIAEKGEERYKKSVVRSKGFRTLISAAAALILMVGAVTVWRNTNQAVFAVVDLDVNPSIELSINGKERVVEAKPVNEDGEAILADMDLQGSDVRAACSAIVGSMLMKGYLNDQSNSILVSVSSGDSEKGHDIEERISDYINTYMDESAIAAAVLGQYIEGDDELMAFAEKNGISPGKAWLIRRILETGGSKMTEDSLLSLSTQELIVLSQERNVAGEKIRGKAYTGTYVGYDGALAAALTHAGLDKSQASDVKVEMDCEGGVIIYEVEFRSGGVEYEYDIIALTGEVAAFEKESSRDHESGSSGAYSGSYDNDDNDDDDDDDEYDDDDDDDEYDDDDDDEYDDDDDDEYDDDDDDHVKSNKTKKNISKHHDDDDDDDDDDD